MASETANPPGAEVFISYAQDEDHAAALALADRVEGVGATVWIAERSIDGAQNYADEIVAAIDACKVVVALCSRASLQSRHVAVELSLAFEAGRPRLPLMLDPTPLPGQVRYWLADANRIDISGPADQWFPRVLRALQRLGVSCGTADETVWPEDEDDVATIAVPRDQSPPSPRVPASDGPAVVPPPRSPGREAVTRADGYRTPRTPRGFFRTPGDIHVHIDGGRNVEEILDLLHELGEPADGTECPAFPAKFNRISRFAGGPQRDDKAFAETYRHHTPGTVQKEDFGSFSTIWLGNDVDLDPSAVPALRKILDTDRRAAWRGRRAGTGDRGARHHRSMARKPIHLASRTRGCSRHPSSRDVPPLDDEHHRDPPLGRPPQARCDSGVVGRRAPDVAPSRRVVPLRQGRVLVLSVERVRGPDRRVPLRRDDGSEAACPTISRRTATSTRCERWSSRCSASGAAASIPATTGHSIPALGEWELSCPPGGHVWVIAANFYGDRSPDVKRAMLENLGRGRGVHVLPAHERRHAATRPVGRGARTRAGRRRVHGRPGPAHRGENVRCVLLSPDLDVQDDRLRRLLQFDYFLCPFDHEMGGYRLESSGLSGERVDDDDMQYLCDALSPLLEPKIRGIAFSAEESWAPRSSNQTVVVHRSRGIGRRPGRAAVAEDARRLRPPRRPRGQHVRQGLPRRAPGPQRVPVDLRSGQ